MCLGIKNPEQGDGWREEDGAKPRTSVISGHEDSSRCISSILANEDLLLRGRRHLDFFVLFCNVRRRGVWTFLDL